MHLTIIATGSRGDIQPMVALGCGLKAAGYRVRLGVPETFAPFVRAHGLEFAPVGGDVRALVESDAMRRALQAGERPVRFLRNMLRAAAPEIERAGRETWAACQGTDAIIAAPLTLLLGYFVAQKLRVPLCLASLQPSAPTRAVPSAGVPPPPRWLPGRGLYNYASYYFTGQLFWQLVRSPSQRSWSSLFPGERLPIWGPRLKEALPHIPMLFGYSPTVLPKFADWGPTQHVTGYWFLDRDPAWRPPAALAEFLASGPPPVYVGFGSMNSRDPEAMTALVVAALRRANRRGVLFTGWGGMGAAVSDDIMPIDAAPHDWLFPRMAAVVHHGGAGTTAAGLRAGIPSILIPFGADQPFWGRRVRALGVGPAPIPLKQLTAARLADAITAATTDDAMIRRAAEIGQQIRSEDGVGNAVRLITEWLARVSRGPYPDSHHQPS